MPPMLLSFFSRALDKHKKERRAQNKLLSNFGMDLAVQHEKAWRKFYRENAPERVNSEILEDLLADFYRSHQHLGYQSKG